MSSKDASNKHPIVVISSIAIIKPNARCPFFNALLFRNPNVNHFERISVSNRDHI